MKNWHKLQADVNMILRKHFTPGRWGARINKIVVHHNAGQLSIEGCYRAWQTRRASAHYQVDVNGKIGQLVWDKNTAWHAGKANRSSIGIEHANATFAPSWTISEATLDNGAHLVAAICKYYRLGRPTWGKNVFPHSYFMATACPGAIAGTQRKAYMARAQYWYDKMTGGKPQPCPAPAPVKRAVARVTGRLVVDGWAGAATVRRAQQIAGTPVDGVITGQATVNRRYHYALKSVTYTGGGRSAFVKALQRRLGVTVDGHMGKQTIMALQRRLGVAVDGSFGNNTARAWQKKLNQNRLF